MYCIWASATCALPSRLLGVLGEDVEDQGGPVDDLDLDDVFELAQLAGGELAVADHGVGAGGEHDVAQLARLARSRCTSPGPACRGAGSAPSSTWEPAVSASAASSAREFSASCDRARGPDADQHHPLEAQLPVLDLGDVLELGGEPGDTAQRLPVGAVVLVAVVVARVCLVERGGGLGAGAAGSRWSSKAEVIVLQGDTNRTARLAVNAAGPLRLPIGRRQPRRRAAAAGRPADGRRARRTPVRPGRRWPPPPGPAGPAAPR